MNGCTHRWILEDQAPSANGKCKLCGAEKFFTGGWTVDDKPIFYGGLVGGGGRYDRLMSKFDTQ